MDCSMPGFPFLHQLLELTQTHVHWVSDAIQPSHPLSSLLLLPSIFPSIRVFLMSQLFASGGQSIGVSASASVLPMNIQDDFLRKRNWFNLLAVQETLKSLLQHHSSKASILWFSAEVISSKLLYNLGSLLKWKLLGFNQSDAWAPRLPFCYIPLIRSHCKSWGQPLSWQSSKNSVRENRVARNWWDYRLTLTLSQ